MAAQDTKFFRSILEAVTEFHKRISLGLPLRTVVKNRIVISPRFARNVLSSMLPRYRAYKDENQFFEELYKNQNTDFNVKRLIVQPEPVLTEQAHKELDEIANLPVEKQEEAQRGWLEKHLGHSEKEEKPTGGGGGKPVAVVVKEENKVEEKEEEQQPGQIQVSQKDVERLIKEEEKWIRPQPRPTVSEPVTTTPEPSRPPTFRPPAIPEGIKTAASSAQMGARNLGEQAANTVGDLVKDAASGLLRNGGRLGARVANGALQAGIRGVAAIAAGGLGAAGATVGGAIALAVVLVIAVLVFVPMFQQQVKDESLLMTGIAQAAPIGPGGDISQCKFTRSGVSRTIPSSRLISIFNEVSAKSGVPTSVLATLAMHESENFTATAPNSHDAFGATGITNSVGCTHFGLVGSGLGSSTTGALGIMQVQPNKSVHDLVRQGVLTKGLSIPTFEQAGAHSTEGVRKGAELADKNYDSLALQDFCDVKTSVYLGAGVLIMKNGGKPPTTSEEVKNSVCSYYGAICTYGAYHYGEEAKADFENCKPVSITPGPLGIAATCPLSQNGSVNATKICGTFSNPENSCGHGNEGFIAGTSRRYYPLCQAPPYAACPYTDQLKSAIDVRLSGTKGINNSVYFPYINGEEKLWSRVGEPTSLKGGVWGYKMIYRTEHQGKTILLDLSHLSYSDVVSGRSGSRVGSTKSDVDEDGGGHLHVALSIDGKWVEPKDAKMCY